MPYLQVHFLPDSRAAKVRCGVAVINTQATSDDLDQVTCKRCKRRPKAVAIACIEEIEAYLARSASLPQRDRAAIEAVIKRYA